VTFAEHAVEGFEVPWTSNPVERLMGEVSKRCKNQWMRWTAEGLEAILQLRLVKYADPEYYQAFLDELLQRSTKTAINCDLSIESTSGKVTGTWNPALQHDQNLVRFLALPEIAFLLGGIFVILLTLGGWYLTTLPD